MPAFLHFKMVMYLLCHFMSGVYNLILQVVAIKILNGISEETFGPLHGVVTIKDYRDL